eukprot:3277442-Rhodomonas_salina.1
MHRPVLTYRMVMILRCGIKPAHIQSNGISFARFGTAITYRSRPGYAESGTNLADATVLDASYTACTDVLLNSAIGLGTCYAVSGTDMAYQASFYYVAPWNRQGLDQFVRYSLPPSPSPSLSL